LILIKNNTAFKLKSITIYTNVLNYIRTIILLVNIMFDFNLILFYTGCCYSLFSTGGYCYTLFCILHLCNFLSKACRTKIFGWRCWFDPKFFNHKLRWWRHSSSWWRHFFV